MEVNEMLDIFLVFVVFLIIVYIFVEVYFKKPLESIFFKAIASLGFIILGSIAIIERMNQNLLDISLLDLLPGAILFLLGLVCGLIGDILLALRPLRDVRDDKKIIISGIASFSLGHLFYMTGLIYFSNFNYLSIVFGAIMTLVIYFGSIWLKFEMGIARIPSLVYTFLIFTMVGQAISMGFQFEFHTFSTLLSIGAILFAISDLILAPIYFKGEKSDMLVIANLSTYYAAQLFIAISLFYII